MRCSDYSKVIQGSLLTLSYNYYPGGSCANNNGNVQSQTITRKSNLAQNYG
jgi:hypothetical protein